MRFDNLGDTPQQDNGMDCGVHVCWMMKHLLVRRLLGAGASQQVDMSLAGRRVDAGKMRREMLRVCEVEKKKQERR